MKLKSQEQVAPTAPASKPSAADWMGGGNCDTSFVIAETPTDTPTATPTSTPTDTPTATPTDTPTDTPTATATPTDGSSSSSSSSSSGGASGSSGGTSRGVSGQYQRKVWASINSGETASVAISNGKIGVTGVSFDVSETIYGPWIKVTRKDSLPSTVKSLGKKVYRHLEKTKQAKVTYIEVEENGIVDSKKIDPSVGWSSAKSIFNKVVLPAPTSPSRITTAGVVNISLISFTT